MPFLWPKGAVFPLNSDGVERKMIDIVERKPVNTGVFLAHDCDSSAAAAVSSGQMVLEPKHDLVVSDESSVAAGDITIPVSVSNDMVAQDFCLHEFPPELRVPLRRH